MISGEAAAFWRGLGIGLAIAAPVGPMSLLCMRRTLTLGPRYGLGTGAGIATADGLYALVAALGLAGVMRFMVVHERPLHLAAGAFLVYLGWRTFFAPTPQARNETSPVRSVGVAFAGALLLTLTNPPTIVSFVAIFTVLVPASFDTFGALAMVSGVFAGSLLWWAFLTTVVTAARHALGSRTRRWIDRLSGFALGVLGAAELRSAV